MISSVELNYKTTQNEITRSIYSNQLTIFFVLTKSPAVRCLVLALCDYIVMTIMRTATTMMIMIIIL